MLLKQNQIYLFIGKTKLNHATLPRSGIELDGSSKGEGLWMRGGGGGGGGGRMHWITDCAGGGAGGSKHGARNSLPGGAGNSSRLAPPIISISYGSNGSRLGDNFG